MKETKIVIEIDPNGRIAADAEGFEGDACLRDLERLLDQAAPGQASVERKRARPEPRVARTQVVVKRKS